MDRHLPAEKAKDVFVSVDRETDGGIIVSGAKVVATSAAMTHYNFMGQSCKTATEDLDMSLMFLVPIDAPGLKLFCRTSYELAAKRNGTPFDYPLSSRFDENDAIFVLDKVFVPWEDVHHLPRPRARPVVPSALGLPERLSAPGLHPLRGEARFSLRPRSPRRCAAPAATNRASTSRCSARRSPIATCSGPCPTRCATTPNPGPAASTAPCCPKARPPLPIACWAPDVYPRLRDIIERTITSALIYLPSSAKDFVNPDIEPYLEQYVRGSHGVGHRERIKMMKLLWDAVGTEFGGRHELYERNYAGSWEDVRMQTLMLGDAAAVRSSRWKRWSSNVIVRLRRERAGTIRPGGGR